MASDVLLLAVRILLLVSLALAAAGPLIGRGGARDHEPTDLALVVDNSASVMRLDGDRLLFETLTGRAQAAVAAARPEDRIWIFPTVGPPLAAGVNPDRAAALLALIAPADGAAELGDAVARAAAALPLEDGRRREVQLLSDLQASAFAEPQYAESGAAPLVAYVPSPPARPNSAVVEVDLTGGTTAPSGSGHAVIVRTERAGGGQAAGGEAAAAAGGEVAAAAGRGPGEADIRLEVDGRLAGAARAPWGAATVLALPRLAPGLHTGSLEASAGGARSDDFGYFALRVVSPPAVRFHGNQSSFAGVGMETLRQAGRIGSEQDAIVAVNEGDAARGAPWAGASTLVFLPPADPVDLAAFNLGLAGAGVEWQALVDLAPGDLGLGQPSLAFSLSGVRVRERYALRPTGSGLAADTTLLATDDGEPWLVRTEAGGRTVLLLASPLTDAASDLPAHAAMIPFLEALLVHWSHLASWPFSGFAAGQPLSLPDWAEEVEAPGGAARSVEGGSSYTPFAAGLYAVRGAGADGAPRQAVFAANVPEIEADHAQFAADDLQELFPGRPVVAAGPDAAAWEESIFRARRGRDIAPWLLAVVAALAAVELFLATPGRSRAGRSRRERLQRQNRATSSASS